MIDEPERLHTLNWLAMRVVLVDARLDLRGPLGRGIGREPEGDPLAVDAGVHAGRDPGDHVGAPSGTIGWMRTNSAASSPGMRMIT